MQVLPARNSASSPPDSLALPESEFALFQRLVQNRAGIWLSDVKKALVFGRLSRRVRELGLRSFLEYYKLVQEDEAECIEMLDRISTNETSFFREPHHFEFLEQRVFPRWAAEAAAGQRQRRIRVWSAGCSSGEEPYSVAMAIRAYEPFTEWDVQIIATDLSTRVLEKAKAAVWPSEKARQIPAAILKLFMLKGVGSRAGEIKVAPEIRSLVRFSRLNLNTDPYPAGPFDLIFCRNVLIYFDRAMKKRVISQAVSLLAPDGVLFVGHSENITLITECVRTVVPTIYVRSGMTCKF